MGYIKEPKGIDLVVVPQTKPDKESDELVSEFIRKEKAQRKVRLKKKYDPSTK